MLKKTNSAALSKQEKTVDTRLTHLDLKKKFKKKQSVF